MQINKRRIYYFTCDGKEGLIGDKKAEAKSIKNNNINNLLEVQ